MIQEITAIILAAGKGTRMKTSLPKVLHPVAGVSLVNHVVLSVLPLVPTKIIGVISQQKVADELKKILPDCVCVPQNEQLGTAHGVKVALPALGDFKGVVFVLYGDTPFIKTKTLQKMAERLADDEQNAVVVLGFSPDDAGSYGRLITQDGELEEIVEYKDANDDQRAVKLCNSGVMAIQGNLLAQLINAVDNKNANGEYYLTDIVALARARGFKSCYVECPPEEVMGINSQAERAVAEEIKQNELRAKMLENGVVLIAPKTVFLHVDTKIAAGVIVHPNVVFGAGVEIEGNVEIKSFSHLEGAVIKRHSVIGPYARLRPGVEIGEGGKVGNFVEIKKSKLGRNVKVSHLTYLGDAQIGDDVNIGAGTVTCNYDGYNKFETRIGNGVFIGSNSSLVAPVEIENGAIVAAGSTVLQNVSADSVVYNDMKQIENKNRAKEKRLKNE